MKRISFAMRLVAAVSLLSLMTMTLRAQGVATSGQAASAKKVTITLVRWPYT